MLNAEKSIRANGTVNLKVAKMKTACALNILGSLVLTASLSASTVLPAVKTTSGTLLGAAQDEVIFYKGIRYGQAPVGDLRWEPPKPFVSEDNFSVKSFGPSCIQQFVFATQDAAELLFNSPPLHEDEDCLFLNVWTPENSEIGAKTPVMFWIHGGSLQFGSGSFFQYDGTSIAKNYGVIVVTINYRTNVFGFPSSEDLFPNKENLGFLDQDLAMQWVQQNIAAFGGDPKQVTIIGQSAGSESVTYALQRHGTNPPFRAAMMESGAVTFLGAPNFTAFDTFAKSVGCNKAAGAQRIACLKKVPVSLISAFLNGPQGTAFGFPIADKQRIIAKQTARVPIVIGVNQDDGTLFTVGDTDLPTFLEGTIGLPVTADQVRAAYSGLNDSTIIPLVFRDVVFSCPSQIIATAYVKSEIPNVFRYLYGAVFADMQKFPGAGCWHTSEIVNIFGTFNQTTATPAEVQLSRTMQTIWTNFIKDPFSNPTPEWKQFLPDNSTQTLSKLAFDGNVELGNVVQPAPAGLIDGPCDKIWNAFLDF
ncbi:Alpha/Beta hydrolase protein [Hysterangium stoloniferum]|nr:Alpha/Beta hydrolase protein [Hysterangium stoloniferum]